MIKYYTLLYDMSIGLIENSLKIFLGGSNNIFIRFKQEDPFLEEREELF